MSHRLDAKRLQNCKSSFYRRIVVASCSETNKECSVLLQQGGVESSEFFPVQQRGCNIFVLFVSKLEIALMKKSTVSLVSLFFVPICYAQAPSFVVEKRGVGKPVLFLPGFATPGWVWNETVKALKEENESSLFTYAGFGGVPQLIRPGTRFLKET